jgi:hypothetical protein
LSNEYPAPEPLVRIAFVIVLVSICRECLGKGFVQGMAVHGRVWSCPCPWCDGTGVDEDDLERFCCLEEAVQR